MSAARWHPVAACAGLSSPVLPDWIPLILRFQILEAWIWRPGAWMPGCWQDWNGLEEVTEVTEVTAFWGEGIGRNSHTLKLQELGGFSLSSPSLSMCFHWCLRIQCYASWLNLQMVFCQATWLSQQESLSNSAPGAGPKVAKFQRPHIFSLDLKSLIIPVRWEPWPECCCDFMYTRLGQHRQQQIQHFLKRCLGECASMPAVRGNSQSCWRCPSGCPSIRHLFWKFHKICHGFNVF